MGDLGLWVFMLIVTSVIPLSMLLVGRTFAKAAPKNINPVLGYRTAMSMKNRQTWEFAHHYCGRLWKRAGGVLLLLSLVVAALTFGKPTDFVGSAGGVLTFAQLAVMIGSIVPVEAALKRTFDKDGRRKSQ